MSKKLTILISPLEWGLGHAGRMIPVAKYLLNQGHEVYAAAGEDHLALFKSEIPGIKTIKFPGFSPGYSRFLPQYLYMLLKVPLLAYYMIKDNRRLKRIAREYSIDILISDNRFGAWNREVKTVYFTHLIRIPLPRYLRFLEPVGTAIHRLIINQYNHCFIPDLQGELNLTGRLSHSVRLPDNAKFTGILSRFTELSLTLSKNTTDHITVLLSGPEPQRSMLLDLLAEQLGTVGSNAVFFCGKPSERETSDNSGNLLFHSHLGTNEMASVILSGSGVIARGGYSTIMELVSIGCSALLVPTPGQTEQEYLADYLTGQGWFASIEQKDIKNGLPLGYQDKKIPYETIVEESRIAFEAAFRELLNN